MEGWLGEENGRCLSGGGDGEVGSSPISGSMLSAWNHTWDSLSLLLLLPLLACARSLFLKNKKTKKNKERPNRLCFSLEHRIEAENIRSSMTGGL